MNYEPAPETILSFFGMPKFRLGVPKPGRKETLTGFETLLAFAIATTLPAKRNKG